ncbi:MAG TPA: aspartate kinase [Actinophytocola sp.]|uniref:aspartate kinase n=1 Tax=Actinophytocola sp. TaxID=1872138 RepID=UPI002DBD7BD4|nr:aspartate kinase [Actinophytocola sp.]HEU5469674.1 aspartate kinase [Actinophytocola sp.]
MSVRRPGTGRRVVWKFGGTSVDDWQKLRRMAARVVAALRKGTQVVAVLSAMGGTTDRLVRLAQQLSTEPEPRELDALLSTGEAMSCALGAIAVRDLGERAVSLTGAQAGMLTDGVHGSARLLRITPDRIEAELNAGAVVLVTGFQGVSESGDVTTLGRGGSDASAIALAAALGLGECDIYTDVPGVFTADPRVVPDARMLAQVSHDEMLRLARAGARVLQPRAVELAVEHGIDIHVRSSFTTEPGTWIRAMPAGAGHLRGIAHIARDPVYTLTHASPAEVSAALDRDGLTMTAASVVGPRLRFTADGSAAAVGAALAAADLDPGIREDLGSVTLVGPASIDRPWIAGRLLDILAAGGMPAELVSSAPGRITGHLPTEAVTDAVRALHEAFAPGAAADLAAALPTGSTDAG